MYRSNVQVDCTSEMSGHDSRFNCWTHKQNENVQYWGEKDEQRHSNCSEDSGMPESGSQSGLDLKLYN